MKNFAITIFIACLFLGCRGTERCVGRPGTDDDLDGWTEEEGDCNDRDALIYPGADEQCNDLDDDCDGLVDLTIDDDGGVWTLMSNNETCACGIWYPTEDYPDGEDPWDCQF